MSLQRAPYAVLLKDVNNLLDDLVDDGDAYRREQIDQAVNTLSVTDRRVCLKALKRTRP
jgi:hypothetical protein